MSDDGFSVSPHSPPDSRAVLFVRLEGRYFVPRAFTAKTRRLGLDIELDVEVDDRGAPHCARLAVVGDVSGKALRSLPLAGLMREAMTHAAETGWEETIEPVEVAGLRTITGAGLRRGPLDATERPDVSARIPRRGSPLTDEHIERVAELYKDALKRGEPPTRTVADEMSVARSTAAKWVAHARDRGYLGPALKGRAGEGES